jgi:monoamine oxidase
VVLQRNTISPKKVIVVGAGISGLATAHELHAKGNAVTILEAKDVIGGRIQSTKVNGQNYELGASFIHGNQNNPVATILEQAGVSTSKVDFDNIVVYKNGHKTEVTDDLEPFFGFVEKQKNQLPGDQSLLRTWQTYSSSRTANANELLYRLRIDTQTEIGADLSDISTLQFDEESGLNGGDYLVTGGYDKVISALSKDIDIRLKHIVTTIKDDGNRVIVSTANNETFTADEVVVTVPLGVLQKGSITFEPVLPKEKLFAVGKLKMGNLHKTFLTFDHVFWDNTTTIGIMRGDGTKWGEFINLAPATGTPTLLALHGGADATSLESLSDAVIGQQAYEVLASAYPKATRPTTVVTSKWYADPFTLGSYSYVPPGASLDMYDTIAEPYGHIHFAGEHTNSSYPSTTHGAYLSGIRAAKEILR